MCTWISVPIFAMCGGGISSGIDIVTRYYEKALWLAIDKILSRMIIFTKWS